MMAVNVDEDFLSEILILLLTGCARGDRGTPTSAYSYTIRGEVGRVP
jgi:hypothetical protein